MKAKAAIIAKLENNEKELEPLRQRIAELEGKETLEKQEEQALALSEAQLQTVSQQKEVLEEQLRDYTENLDQLQAMISRIPGPSKDSASMSPFERIKQRILSALPASYSIPSVIEIESDQKTYTCKLLETLLQLFQTYLDTQAGQEIEQQLTQQLDTFYEGRSPVLVATTLLNYLHYANGEELADVDASFLNTQSLKGLEPNADSVFFKGQEELREAVQALNVRLAGKNVPSYSVFFFLYLLALRDWVNCIDLSSRPGRCPIPERLQRPTLKCP